MAEQGHNAVVVGGGIAGLTAAASLLREGWNVTVLEQAPSFAEVGAGLALTTNGLSALAAVGADAAARAAGNRVHMAGTMDERGRWLMKISGNGGSRTAPEFYGIHRQELHRLLLASAQGATLVNGVRVTSIDPGQADGPRAMVQTGSEEGSNSYEADLVVGADGLRSALRTRLAPATTPHYSGKSSWRGIIDDSALVSDDVVVRWGPGTEFGAVRIGAGQVYWYGYTHSAEEKDSPDEKADALDHFRGWAEPVPSLIGATPGHRIMRHNVYALAPELRTFVHGRTVLIGDAAHAMVPTMGQGANSSLEDGVCVGLLIARAVNDGATLASALQIFDDQRRPRTQRMARRSHRAGQIGADLRGKPGISIRNSILRAIPGHVAARAGMSVLSWKAPLR